MIMPKLYKKSAESFSDVLRFAISLMREGIFVVTLVNGGVVPSLFRGGARVGIGRKAVEAVPTSLFHSMAT
jgi:hypothetical protein